MLLVLQYIYLNMPEKIQVLSSNCENYFLNLWTIAKNQKNKPGKQMVANIYILNYLYILLAIIIYLCNKYHIK